MSENQYDQMPKYVYKKFANVHSSTVWNACGQNVITQIFGEEVICNYAITPDISKSLLFQPFAVIAKNEDKRMSVIGSLGHFVDYDKSDGVKALKTFQSH